MDFKGKNYWALVLGGSSGFGLATAQRLARAGMNICIVHRDRKGSMPKVDEEFQKIRDTGAKLITFNTNALTEEGRTEVLDALSGDEGINGGRIRLLMHSIALGNLKVLAKIPETDKEERAGARQKLAEKLGVSVDAVSSAVQDLFDEGVDSMHLLTEPPDYDDELLMEDEDIALTVHAMGTSLLAWVQECLGREMFAEDARVIGLTSEGNQIAWRGYAAVGAAKVALEALSRSMALEFAPYGLRSNIVQAGVTDTPALRLIPGNTHMKSGVRLRNPFGRLTTPEDVAGFIGLLCTDEASWINGEIIRVDGGEHIAG